MTKTYLGAVIEFRLPKYFVYGVCVEENLRSGDILMMFAPKFAEPIKNVDVLYETPIRHRIKFATLYARSRKNADILKIIGTMDIDRLPQWTADSAVTCRASLHDPVGKSLMAISGLWFPF